MSERCLNDGNTVAPFLVLPAGNMKQIVQTSDHLVVLSETMGSLRIIPIGKANGQVQAGGGLWDGHVLVVETSGFAPNDRIRVGPTMRFTSSPKSKITERFTRSSPDEIVYRFTVEDPTSTPAHGQPRQPSYDPTRACTNAAARKQTTRSSTCSWARA